MQGGLKKATRTLPLIASCLALTALGAPAASAKIITIGPPEGARYTKLIRATVAATFFNGSITEPGAVATSPVDGALVGIGIAGASGGPYRLRVLRPLGGNLFVGAGTSNPLFFEPPEATVLKPLPIREGDMIGLDLEQGLTLATSEPTAAATTASWVPPLADEEERGYGSFRSTHEFGFNAQLLPLPEILSVRPRKVDLRRPRQVTITGENLIYVRGVFFGSKKAWRVRFISERKLVVVPPLSRSPRKTRVVVKTVAGSSPESPATMFTFTRRSGR